DFRFEESTVAGARIESGSSAAVAVRNDIVSYETDAVVDGLDLQRFGRTFDIAALSTDRLNSTINGRVLARGTGTALNEMMLDASGTLSQSTILGGRRPHL